MKRNSITSVNVKQSDINRRLNDTLIQYFYSFGVEPNSLDISDLTLDRVFLKPDYKEVQLISEYPPYERSQSSIESNIIMNHCFPNGYSLKEKEKQPEDEFFYFDLDNLFSLINENKKLYFVCVIIYEPFKSYLKIKSNNEIPESIKSEPGIKKEESNESDKNKDKNKEETPQKKENKEIKKKEILIDNIYVPKALCLSSFVSFPHEIKLLLKELLKYIRSDDITIPIEKIIETMIFGIPRPLRAYFYLSCNKSNWIIPRQNTDIDFILREFNQYKFSSYAFQSIFKFIPKNILSIYKCLLLEIPIIFFSVNKELLSNIIESFLSLLYPLEYQYPHISILPDSNAGIIELEKCFVLGINREFKFEKKESQIIVTYFKEMNLNLPNKAILLCDIDLGKINSLCYEFDKLNYHIVNFDDLGVYNDINMIDHSQCISKEAFNGKYEDIHNSSLPERYSEKLKSKLEEYIKDKSSKSNDYGLNNNKKIGEDFFYYFLASIFLNYNSYLYNSEDEVKKICTDILTKKEDEINIETLFNVNQFLHDFKYDYGFYSKFFKTRMFKNFIVRKYLNLPLDRYTFLLFDEKILEKKSKSFLARKVDTKFISSKSFQSTRTYQIKSPNNFSEDELTYIKNNKDILFNKYYQQMDKDNKIHYTLFPKLIYDNKFFNKEYKPSINFIGNTNLINYLKGYQIIEDSLKNPENKELFSIYNGTLVNRYLININKFEFQKEIINSLYYVWVIVFTMTFYYCDEKEKYFRFEELMRFLPKLIDFEEKSLSILLITIRKYGDENMMIKLFELIKNLKYGEYACLCSKFKNNSKLNWDEKSVEVANSRLIISYYRDPKSDDKKLSEIKEINYDIKSIKKRTFSTSKDSQENNFSEKEKISFDIFFKCQNCGKEIQITEIAVNLENKLKSSLMICPECNKYSEAKSHAVYGHEKYEFNLYSPLKLLDIAKEILNEYGVRIDLEELRQKYNSFFWSCVLYFSLNGLSFEMLLKYKTNEVSKENIKIEKEKEKVIQKKKKKVFKILEIQSQKNEI